MNQVQKGILRDWGGGKGWFTQGVGFLVVKMPMALQSLRAGSVALTRQK